jgi:hypothetical protein
MPGLVPGIHVSMARTKKTRKHVDGRDEPGHDGLVALEFHRASRFVLKKL